MLLLHKLVKAAQTKTILPNTEFNKRGTKARRSKPRSKVLCPTGRVGENPENKVEKITLIAH